MWAGALNTSKCFWLSPWGDKKTTFWKVRDHQIPAWYWWVSCSRHPCCYKKSLQAWTLYSKSSHWKSRHCKTSQFTMEGGWKLQTSVHILQFKRVWNVPRWSALFDATFPSFRRRHHICVWRHILAPHCLTSHFHLAPRHLDTHLETSCFFSTGFWPLKWHLVRGAVWNACFGLFWPLKWHLVRGAVWNACFGLFWHWNSKFKIAKVLHAMPAQCDFALATKLFLHLVRFHGTVWERSGMVWNRSGTVWNEVWNGIGRFAPNLGNRTGSKMFQLSCC